jgi:hypothetical protein
MSIENLSGELSESVADWFMVYGKCRDCMIDDNGGDDPELDMRDVVPAHQCRRCFISSLQAEIDKKIDPTIKTKFCPTCGKPKDA